MSSRVVIGAVALSVFAGVAGADVNWSSESYSQILARAKAEQKYVFIDFYATWCGPCKRLDEKTYPDAKASALLNSMIAVKWDAEKEPWLATAKQYKVHAYPSLVVLSPDGVEVDRHLGYLPPEEFVATIDGFRQGKGTTADLARQLEGSPDHLELLYQLGMKYADTGRSEEASTVITKAMKLDPKDTRGRNAEMLYSLGQAYYNNDQFAEAKVHFKRLTAEYASSEWYDNGMQRLAGTEYKLGNKDAAVATYWKVTEKKQSDPSALNGFAWFCAQRKIGLDKALPAARQAAELSGRDPGILDTLAEVYFAMGDYDNAIKVGQEAASKEPNDVYFKDQVEKYKKAKAEADQARR